MNLNFITSNTKYTGNLQSSRSYNFQIWNSVGSRESSTSSRIILQVTLVFSRSVGGRRRHAATVVALVTSQAALDNNLRSLIIDIANEGTIALTRRFLRNKDPSGNIIVNSHKFCQM